MTPPTSFNPDTKAEIQRVLGSNTTATVYILGDTGAISASTETAIHNMGYKTDRLAGPTRYETSLAIAAAISTQPQFVMLATGMNFPDALGAGAAAGSYNVGGSGIKAVVVLSNNTTMPSSTENYLVNWVDTANAGGNDVALFAIGDQAKSALDSAGWTGYTTVAGPNRYATAQAVAETFYGGPTSAAVTTGLNWPDALAGGALCGTVNAPLLLTSGSTTLSTETGRYLTWRSGSIHLGVIFGGTLPAANVTEIGDAISGPGHFDVLDPGTHLSFGQSSNSLTQSLATSGGQMRQPATSKPQHR